MGSVPVPEKGVAVATYYIVPSLSRTPRAHPLTHLVRDRARAVRDIVGAHDGNNHGHNYYRSYIHCSMDNRNRQIQHEVSPNNIQLANAIFPIALFIVGIPVTVYLVGEKCTRRFLAHAASLWDGSRGSSSP